MEVSDEAFLAYLGARLPGGDALTAVRRVRAVDLYLACACATGDPAALKAFEERILEPVDASMKKMNLPPSAVDEARQYLRTILFLSEKDRGPRIGEYRGAGALKAWVRAGAVRASLRAGYRPKGQVDVDAAVLEQVAAPGDHEFDYVQKRYGDDFKRAIWTAFRTLSAEQRNVLRHHFAHGLTIDDLATLYKVHRATAARRLASARGALAEQTREVLAEHLGARPSEVESIARVVLNGLDVTLERLLKTEESPESR